MIPRGAGSGIGRSRFSSDCSTYRWCCKTCVRKNAPTRRTKPTH